MAANVYRAFRSAGLFLLTDIEIVINEAEEEKFCLQQGGRFTCNDGSCYTISQKCDGVFNCLDGADELECMCLMHDHRFVDSLSLCRLTIGLDEPVPMFTPIKKRLWPFWDRFVTFSFAWVSSSTYPDGRAQITQPVPAAIATWVVSAISISQQHGLSVLPSVLLVLYDWLSSFPSSNMYLAFFLVRRNSTIFHNHGDSWEGPSRRTDRCACWCIQFPKASNRSKWSMISERRHLKLKWIGFDHPSCFARLSFRQCRSRRTSILVRTTNIQWTTPCSDHCKPSIDWCEPSLKTQSV